MHDLRATEHIARILLVEDDLDTIQLLKHTLQQDDFELYVARNGKDALQLLELFLPDLIISDVMMPTMDGFEFRRHLCERADFELIPFLFLTARKELEDKLAGLSQRVSDYITKPFQPKEFLYRVRGIIENYKNYRKIAYYDPLTGLLNRRELEKQIRYELNRQRRYGRPLSFLLLDIDNFKNINDTYGHPIGDQVLEEISACIEEEKRTVDLAGRMGGEEFLVVMPETERIACKYLAERLRVRISSVAFSELALHITVSGGAATAPDDGSEFRELLKKADKALYQAKQTGKNRISYDTLTPGTGAVGLKDAETKDRFLVQVSADLGELAPRYLERKRDEIERMFRSLTSNDFHAIQLFAHKLQGSGGGYGFDKLSLLGGDLQQAALRKEELEVELHLKRIDHYLEKVDLEFIR